MTQSDIGLLYSSACLQHVSHRVDVRQVHPESPQRLRTVYEALERDALWRRVELCTPNPVDRALLEKVHTPAYVSHVEALCQAGGGRLDEEDTSVVAASWSSALEAAGAVVDAARGVLNRRWRRAFCAVRPPGHHALSDRAMGFCVFGSVALGAEAALQSGLAKRVAVLDWDVHHGNGTQDIFWRRGDVMVANIHQFPFWPGSGAISEIGEGEGKGTTVNCPIAMGEGNEAYMQAWNERVYPAFAEFAPDLIIISAGFDADARDPLGGLTVTAKGFVELSNAVMRFADTQCEGRVVSVLEGGYSLAALAENVPLHIGTML